jgi:hypothetical protein
VRREAWSARREQLAPVSEERTVTTDNAATATRTAGATAVTAPVPPVRRWTQGGVFLALAGQLITVSALTSADPIPATWSALLLACAPAPLALVAVYALAPVNRLAVVAALVAIIVGGAGQILHTGLFFLPALMVLAVAAAKLWRERS